MPKDSNIQGQQRRALSGTATVLATASAPASGGPGVGGGIACDVCGLNLPRSATHIDVVAHPCYRLFTTISLSAAGHLSLA